MLANLELMLDLLSFPRITHNPVNVKFMATILSSLLKSITVEEALFKTFFVLKRKLKFLIKF